MKMKCLLRELVVFLKKKESSDKSSSGKSNVNDNCGVQNTNEQEEEDAAVEVPISSNEEASGNLCTEMSNDMTCSEARIYHYKHFDTAKDPLDHHFLDSNGQVGCAILTTVPSS